MSASVRVAAFLVAIFIPAAATTGFQPLFLADRGLAPAAVGEILAIATIVRMLAMPLWGLLADRLGRRRDILLTASALAALWALAWLPAQGHLALLLLTCGFGACACALMPMADAVSLSLARAGRLDYGPVRAVGSIGFMLSIAATGQLAGAFGSDVLPWLVAIPYAIGAVLARGLPGADTPGLARGGGGLLLLRSKVFRLTLAASALLQGGHAAVYGLGSLHWRGHGISERVIGLLWADGVLAEILFFFFARPLATRIGPAGLVAIAGTAAVLRWSVTASTTALPALFAMQALHGATYGMTHLAAMLLLSRAVPPERAGAAQTLHAAIGVALPVGVLMWVTGQAYDGSGAVFLLMAAMGVGAWVVAWEIRREVRKGVLF